MNSEYFEEIKKSYNSNSDSQLYLKARVFKTFNKLLVYLFNKEINDKMSLLDLGSSDGSFVEIAKDKGLKAIGLDINDVNLEKDKLPFENESFDLITANSLIEHINNPSNLLRETKRVLKKDGFFIIVTPDWSLNSKFFYDDPTHVHPYTSRSLKFLLSSMDFKNINVLPWLVCKPTWMWKIPFKFLLARLIPFRGDSSNLIPNFLKGKSKTLLAVCKK